MSELDDLLSLDIGDVATEIPTTGKPVPNIFPTITNQPYRIAIIGDCPSQDDERIGQPFVGTSGKFLNALLAKHNILRDACFLGNACQIRPPGGDITKFERDGEEVQRGLYNLYLDLAKYKPNICLLLGKLPLWAFHSNNGAQLDSWRGSLFVDTHNIKCLVSHHPSTCLRQYDYTPLLTFDIGKAKQESFSPILQINERYLETKLTVDETINRLEQVSLTKPLIALDIEGYVDAMSCLSIATSSTDCFIVPFSTRDGRNYYSSPDDERRVWKALIAVLADPKIPKVLQNSLYDRFVLQYSYNIVIRGVVDDTMLKHHELYCELEKSLGFQCSLYTKQPYYKSDRKSDDRETFWRYCCMDSAVTHEINTKLEQWLQGPEKAHYRFNIDLLNPILYMENRGIKYDTALASKRQTEIQQLVYETQYKIDQIAGKGLPKNSTPESLVSLIRSTMCFKRDDSTPKKAFVNDLPKCIELANGYPQCSVSDLGYLSTALGMSLNTKGEGLKEYLYGELKLPTQYAIDPNTKQKRISTNYESLLRLTKLSDNPILPLILDMGELRTRSQMLAISADKDGRIRCGYNIVGTETGRLTCYTSPTGSGYNLQTIPSENTLKPLDHPCRNGMRDLFVADDGYYIFQCDLSGADGWTVAAHLASLGDPTMLDDYRAGIKPAKVLCYLMRHGASSLTGKTRQEIKDLTKSVEKDSWDYFASKIGQHGTSYLMGARKLANQVFIQSEGRIVVSESDMKNLQRLFTIRYRVQIWHDWMKRHLAKQPYPPKLSGASGMTRKFFGRQTDVLGQALAHEPQVNTTYATNLAAHRLWNDRENRKFESYQRRDIQDLSTASLRTLLKIEPLHQVHDALLGQFKITDTEWAITKIKQWFDNEIVIAGIKLKIPFEGNYGTNWALDKQSKVGDI